jgi:hypothetical protein
VTSSWQLVLERDRALRSAALHRYQAALYRRALLFSLTFVIVSLILSTTLFALAIVAAVLIRGWQFGQFGGRPDRSEAARTASREGP